MPTYKASTATKLFETWVKSFYFSIVISLLNEAIVYTPFFPAMCFSKIVIYRILKMQVARVN